MGSLRTLIRRCSTAILLGVAAAAAIHLPPFELATHANGAVYDAWSRGSAPDAPADIVVVALEDPAWLTTLAAIAHREHAQLLITTLAQPPSPSANALSFGPTELAVDGQLLRRSDWAHGGHLWFETEADGIVRRDATFIGGADPIPSLAFSAANRLAAADGHGAKSPAGPPATAHPQPTAGLGRQLRFFEPRSIARVTPREVLANTGRLSGNIVIAGRNQPVYATPVGALPAHELLAHVLGGYRGDIWIRSSRLASSAGWIAALLLLATGALKPRAFAGRRWVLPLGGAGAILGLSAAAFYAASLWIPPVGPIVLLVAAGSLMAARPSRRTRQTTAPTDLAAARLALTAGDFEHAWQLYRGIPPTAAVLNELYDFANRLEQSNYVEHAADVFHRIALVEVHHRDVAQRLVGATRPRSPANDGPPPPDDAPTMLGRYRLIAPIGSGSTGKVFLGSDPKINRLLAIKVIDLSAARETGEMVEAAERFRREAETAGRLNHPNIVTIFDIGESGGLAYIAMEYLKGRHLSDFTQPGKLLPPALVLELAAQTAEALHYAHVQNVVHRDIKPANIMYDSVSGSLKITDFGIARLIDVSRTRTGIVLGTPSFMAPEQLEGGNVNGHTDLFALGVSLYELLTGRLPFRGASMTKLMFVIVNEPHQPITAVRPDLPEQLDTLIDTALAKNPADRFQSGAEMADALRAVAGQLG
jgi:CHASE2 domain-containing sensor protein